MGFARQVADRVVFMDNGEIVEINAPAPFFDHPQHPRTKAVPEPDFAVKFCVASVLPTISSAGERSLHAWEGGLETMKRKVPRMTTDEEAEAFLGQDLSDLDITQFKPVKFEFLAKAARLNMRLPQPLLDAVKARAKARGVPTTRFVREVLEQATVLKPERTRR